ncbi:ATP-NAD kinase-like domain-containing protein [Sparassis latifolia]
MDAPISLSVASGHHISTFSLTTTSLLVSRTGDKKWPQIETDVYNVIWAELTDNNVLEISLLARKKKSAPLSFVQINVNLHDKDKVAANAFTDALMSAAYTGVKRQRRLKVLVNPKSGPGNAVQHYIKQVEPIFRAARCLIDTTFTTHVKHGLDIAKELPLDDFDVVVTVSGDGLVHEVLNGFAAHADPTRAFRTPLTPVPSGSGNGLAVNLLGVQDGYDVAAAALNAVKGLPMSVDLFSVTQKDRRVFSFMSQVVGLLADLDLRTERLRFMGSNRFILGYLHGVIVKRRCPVKLSIKVAEADKHRMVHNLHNSRSKTTLRSPRAEPPSPDSGPATPKSPLPPMSPLPPLSLPSATLPELQHTDADADGWIAFDKPLVYMYAGKGPYVSRDLMQFPVSLPDDGLIDIVIQEMTSRRVLLHGMEVAHKGEQYWLESQRYLKAQAYRVEPYSKKGCLAVDGEAYPFEAFQVEVHQGLATLLSPCGFYKVEFDFPGKKKGAP